jgi:hypothetical protein
MLSPSDFDFDSLDKALASYEVIGDMSKIRAMIANKKPGKDEKSAVCPMTTRFGPQRPSALTHHFLRRQ